MIYLLIVFTVVPECRGKCVPKAACCHCSGFCRTPRLAPSGSTRASAAETQAEAEALLSHLVNRIVPKEIFECMTTSLKICGRLYAYKSLYYTHREAVADGMRPVFQSPRGREKEGLRNPRAKTAGDGGAGLASISGYFHVFLLSFPK